jgi:catechol O-methyltransferase
MPEDGRLVSIEFNPANADIARRIWDQAGVGDRIRVVVGALGDEGRTLARLEAKEGFGPGSLDFVFIDHDKSAYLPDLRRLMNRGWLHPGSIVVADNVKLPGAPEYRDFMRAEQGKAWHTVEHDTHAEYQSLFKDLVFESEYLGQA